MAFFTPSVFMMDTSKPPNSLFSEWFISVKLIIFIFRHFGLAFVNLPTWPRCALVARGLFWPTYAGLDRNLFEHRAQLIFVLYLLVGQVRVDWKRFWRSHLRFVPWCRFVKDDISTYMSLSSRGVIALCAPFSVVSILCAYTSLFLERVPMLLAELVDCTYTFNLFPFEDWELDDDFLLLHYLEFSEIDMDDSLIL